MTRARLNKRNSDGISKRVAKKAKRAVTEEEIGSDGFGVNVSYIRLLTQSNHNMN